MNFASFNYLISRAAIALAISIACSLGAHAETVADIYAATIDVEGRTTSALRLARRQGLGEVVVKATGAADAVENQLVQDAFSEVDKYLLGYSYIEEETGLRIRLEYDEAAIQRLLAEAALPLWTANRPTVLTWLVVNDGSRRRFASMEELPEAHAALNDRFSRRGLPLHTPIYDLEDTAALSPGEAWRQSSGALTSASQRYRSAEILAGRVALLSSGVVSGDWQFLDGGVWRRKSVQADSLEAFIDAGADMAATLLAGRYAVAAASMDLRHRVNLRGVRGFDDYRSALQALESLEAVRRVMPEFLQGDLVSLRVDADADIARLARIIELDERFTPTSSASQGPELNYEWIR